MALNISLPSTAITELQSYRTYDANGVALKDVITSIQLSTWVDVSYWVEDIMIDGSVNNLSGEPGANSASIQLANKDKRFSDLNAAGPWYGNLLPGKNVKIELSCSRDIFDRGDCESATPPMVAGETVPFLANATFSQSSTVAHVGTNSYKFTKTVAAGTAAYIALTDNLYTDHMHGFVAGQSVNLSLYVWVPSGGILGSEITINIADYQGAFDTTTVAVANLYDQWQLVTLARTLRSACTGVYIRIGVINTASLNEYFYVDDLTGTANPPFRAATVPIFTGKVDEQGFVESRAGHEGIVSISVKDTVDALSKKKFDKDYYYTSKYLVDTTSTAHSLLHILLNAHGGMDLSMIVCNGTVPITVPYTTFKEGESVQFRLQELAKGCLAQYAGCRYDGRYVMESRLTTGWSLPASEYTITASDYEVDVRKSLMPLLGNNVKVRGSQVDFYGDQLLLWKLSKVKPTGTNSLFPDYCWEAVADDAYFLCDPAATPPRENWIQYDVGVGEIIHVQSAAISQVVYEGTSAVLTTTGTDLIAKEAQGKLVLQNLYGSLVHVMDIEIRGSAAIKRTIRNHYQNQEQLKKYLQDNGLSDDDADWARISVDSNASSILSYGQKDFVVSSEYIVDDDQQVAILDWWLKYGKDPKHQFEVNTLPFLAFIQPGAPATLDLTGLGYNGSVQVASFSHHIVPDGARTNLVLDEMVGDWVVSTAASIRLALPGTIDVPVQPVDVVPISDGLGMSDDIGNGGPNDPLASGELFVFDSPDLTSSEGRAPQTGSVTIYLPAKMGTTADPQMRWAGRGIVGVFQAATNLQPYPEDWTVYSGATMATGPTQEYVFALDKIVTKIPFGAGSELIWRTVAAGEDITGKTFTLWVTVYCTGPGYIFIDLNDDATWAEAWIEKVAVVAGINRISATRTFGAGAARTNIDCHLANHDASGNMAAGGSGKGAAAQGAITFWVIDSQLEKSVFRTPYVPSSRAAGQLSFRYPWGQAGRWEGWINCQANYDGADDYVHVHNAPGGTSSLKLFFDATDDKIHFYLKGATTNIDLSTAAFNAAKLNQWAWALITWDVSAKTFALVVKTVDLSMDSTATDTTTTLGAIAWDSVTYFGCESAETLVSYSWYNDIRISDAYDASTAHFTLARPWFIISERGTIERSILMSSASARFTNVPIVITDKYGRLIKISNEAGLWAQDAAGTGLHDLPNAVLQKNSFRMGHLYRHSYNNAVYTLFNGSVTLDAWQTDMPIFTDGNTNIQGVRLKYAIYSTGSPASEAKALICVRPTGSSWGVSVTNMSVQNYVRVQASVTAVNFIGEIDAPVANGKFDYYVSLGPAGTTHNMVLQQVGYWV